MNLKNLFHGKKIAVWGDIILDEYVLTVSKRISREAPVPVTEFESNYFKPGGAGNVIMNLKTLGATPIPLGILGDDPAGDEICSMFKKSKIDTTGLLRTGSFKTPKKSRILSGSINTKKQQILRIDHLYKKGISGAIYKKLEITLKDVIPKCDLIIVSDYLKKSVTTGLFFSLRRIAPDKIFILDSRENLLDYKGIDFITPNEPEFKKLFPGELFNNEPDYIKHGTELLKKLNYRGIILKRGHKGMIIFEQGKDPVDIPIHGSANIVDVTGAGDTVISVLAASLAAGESLLHSSDLANKGASIVVMKEGAYPLTIEELEAEL